MCGRYDFSVEQSEEIMDILKKVSERFQGKEAKTGEIFPTNLVPILTLEDQAIEPSLSTWGFPKFDGKGVIINARAESAFEKKTFRESLVNRRCIIPSTGFYEWDSAKTKHMFHLADMNALYMAGLYSNYGGESRYVILTTAANESIKDIHTRMPLIIPKQDIKDWIMDQSATSDFLKRVPPALRVS